MGQVYHSFMVKAQVYHASISPMMGIAQHDFRLIELLIAL